MTYNKHHVAVGTTRQNYIWLHPRKSPYSCHFEIKIDKEKIDEAKSKLEEIGIAYTPRKEDSLAISIQSDQLKEHVSTITELINQSIRFYS